MYVAWYVNKQLAVCTVNKQLLAVCSMIVNKQLLDVCMTCKQTITGCM